VIKHKSCLKVTFLVQSFCFHAQSLKHDRGRRKILHNTTVRQQTMQKTTNTQTGNINLLIKRAFWQLPNFIICLTINSHIRLVYSIFLFLSNEEVGN
jgi:hypothetical protein